MKTSTVLKNAKQLLIDKGWTRRSFARDKHSHPVHYRSSRAARFCINGACAFVAPGYNSFKAHLLLREVIGGDIVIFNDTAKSVKPVLEAFDKAIKLAEERRQ